MNEEQREHGHAFLKVNKHDLFKQKTEDTLETFKDRVKSVITDAPQLSFILFPIIIFTVIGSFIKDVSCYLFRVATFDNSLRLAYVRISDEESELLNKLDKFQGCTNIELQNMERTKTIIEHDIYFSDRDFLSKYMIKFREDLITRNNKLRVNIIGCNSTNRLKITFGEYYIDKLIYIICSNEIPIVYDGITSYLLASKNDLILIQDKIRKIMIDPSITLTLSQKNCNIK